MNKIFLSPNTMNKLHRRTFLAGTSLAAIAASMGFALPTAPRHPKDLERLKQRVQFTRDGLDLSPLEYALDLRELAENNSIETDYYSNGGSVAKLEETFASMLGKRRAVFMPTGTLANHLAIRHLAGKHRRIIVQADSHIYRDSGDCAQTLSQLNLLPLNPGTVNFSLDDVKELIHRTKLGRVDTRIGTISIESPVRRHLNKMFDFEEMRNISEFARNENIGLHLDGARLFNASFHSGIRPEDYAKLFDTVYVSMYKNFNAASGAILAGDGAFLDELFHTRRMFGGGMPQVWPFAAIALKYAEQFPEAYKKANENTAQLIGLLNIHKEFKAERIVDGTNVFRLQLNGPGASDFQDKLHAINIDLPAPAQEFNGFFLKINPTINRMVPEKIVSAFLKCC